MSQAAGQFCQSKRKAPLPPEAAAGLRSAFFSLFGSPAQLDAWLTRIADDLADARNPRTRPLTLNPANIPPALQVWMHRPFEVVDMLLERLHDLAVWGYTAKIVKQGKIWPVAIITDQSSGHIIEEAAGPDVDILVRILAAKYGHNFEVVEE